MSNAKMKRIYTFEGMEIVDLGGNVFELVLGPYEN
jgi:hypothetical protein